MDSKPLTSDQIELIKGLKLEELRGTFENSTGSGQLHVLSLSTCLQSTFTVLGKALLDSSCRRLSLGSRVNLKSYCPIKHLGLFPHNTETRLTAE